MSQFKPNMDAGSAAAFLNDYWNGEVSGLQAVEQGELSRAYFFQVKGNDYIIRFNHSGEGFARELSLYEHYHAQGLPMPRIVDTGKREDLYYCISERAPGTTLVRLPIDRIREIVPRLAEKFAQLRQLHVDGTTGYGWVNRTGNGDYDSWPAYLASFFAEEQTGFWFGWYRLFEEGILERDVFRALYDRMMEFAQAAPPERYLVHGDFHLGNIITDGHGITGIVDWEMSVYGDFVFDLATMHLWTQQLQFPHLFRNYLAYQGIEIPYFEERLRCGLLFKGLDALRFFAKKEDRIAYLQMRTDLLSLLQ
jgi:hygromycin-B 4-O-kinase